MADLLQVPWASLGRAPVLVELDRLYLLAGPKEEFEDADSVLEQVPAGVQYGLNNIRTNTVAVCCSGL